VPCNEKTSSEDFSAIFKQAAEDKYQKALVIETLKDTPQSVSEISEKIGLLVYTVFLWVLLKIRILVRGQGMRKF